MKSFKITQSITDRQDASLGLYFKDVSKLSLLSSEEEIELTKRIKEGDEKATKKLIESNLRFVISVAKQYQGKGIPLVDLIQEGNCGLIQSARLFDPSKGFRFISYAVWWIRQSIMKAISEQCRTIRIPMNQIACMSKINKATEKFEQLNERTPSSYELEEETNIEADKINSTMAFTGRTVSLESPLKDEEVNCLLDILPDEGASSTDSIATENDLSNAIETILTKLSYRDSDILRMSFGIGMHAMPNNEIANRFGIGIERVRQIQHKAINYIRKNYMEDLKELL